MCTRNWQTLVILKNKQGGDNMAVSTMNILVICVTILLLQSLQRMIKMIKMVRNNANT